MLEEFSPPKDKAEYDSKNLQESSRKRKLRAVLEWKMEG